MIGLSGLVALRGAQEGEIWYLVSPKWWGKGIATAAVKKLLDLGFAEIGLHRMWATCLPENPAFAHVLEKVGMRREGFLVKTLKIHGEWKSSYCTPSSRRNGAAPHHPNRTHLSCNGALEVSLGYYTFGDLTPNTHALGVVGGNLVLSTRPARPRSRL